MKSYKEESYELEVNKDGKVNTIIFTYDDSKNNYMVNEKGEIVSNDSASFNLESGTFVRRIDLNEGEISDTQIEKNKKRMVYIGEIIKTEIDNGKTIYYDADTLEILKSDDNTNWVGSYYVRFTDSEKNNIQLIVNSDLSGITYSNSSGYELKVIDNNLGLNFNIKRNDVDDIIYAYRSRNIYEREFENQREDVSTRVNGSLLAVHLSPGVTTIGDSAFNNCIVLREIKKIPYGVTDIGYSAFYGCSELTHIEILSSVMTISMSAFSNCINLEQVTISNTIETIYNDAFSECNNIDTVIITECSSIDDVNVDIKTAFNIIITEDVTNNTHTYELDTANNTITFKKI